MRLIPYVIVVLATGVAAQLVITSQTMSMNEAGPAAAGGPGSVREAAPQRPSAALAPLIAEDYLVAAPARIETASEEIAIAAPVIGLLAEVVVKEGDEVKRGQVIARIDNDDYKATLAKAEAQLRLNEAQLLRVNNGARPQERLQALASVHEAEAVVRNAAIALQRQQQLSATGYASQAALDQATRESNVARQRLEAAKQKFALVDDPARNEDVAIAQAQVDVAHAARDEAQAALNKTIIRSPIDGTVLRVDRHPGELVSTFLDTPILMIGDPSKLNARAEVDEADIAKLRPNMPAYVTAEAFGGQRFAGHVVRIGRMVGKKNVHTDEPRERTDTKILEVLIQLDQSASLPAGLRVNAFMLGAKVAQHSSQPQRAAGN